MLCPIAVLMRAMSLVLQLPLIMPAKMATTTLSHEALIRSQIIPMGLFKGDGGGVHCKTDVSFIQAVIIGLSGCAAQKISSLSVSLFY